MLLDAKGTEINSVLLNHQFPLIWNFIVDSKAIYKLVLVILSAPLLFDFYFLNLNQREGDSSGPKDTKKTQLILESRN